MTAHSALRFATALGCASLFAGAMVSAQGLMLPSSLAPEGTNALSDSVRSQEVPVYVMCHHGNRSMQVTMWLAQQGWKNVFNVRGGIDEYARKVDQSVGFY